jgi:hypothetical protein
MRVLGALAAVLTAVLPATSLAAPKAKPATAKPATAKPA